VDSGRNVLLAASPVLSETMRSLASECGVDFDDKNTQVFDHFTNAGDHSVVASSNVVPAPVIVGTKIDAPVLFKGIAHTVPSDAELITVALSGTPTTYSADPKKGVSDSPVAGTATALVSLRQVRPRARPGEGPPAGSRLPSGGAPCARPRCRRQSE
jgi:oligosaccharyltransferase complex subunit beta